MNARGFSLFLVGLVGTGLIAGYRYTQEPQVDVLSRQVAVLTRQLYATQDSLTVLWNATRMMVPGWASDTTRQPPVCPGPLCPRVPPPPQWARPPLPH